MSNELVSVIIPSFKMGHFIGEALESVEAFLARFARKKLKSGNADMLKSAGPSTLDSKLPKGHLAKPRFSTPSAPDGSWAQLISGAKQRIKTS